MTLKLVLDHFELSPCYHQFTHAWGIGHHCHMTNCKQKKQNKNACSCKKGKYSPTLPLRIIRYFLHLP